VTQGFSRTADQPLMGTWQLMLCFAACIGLQDHGGAGDMKSVRHVELTAVLSIRSTSNGCMSVWIPVPQSSPLQLTTQLLCNGSLPLKLTQERRYGNQMLYANTAASDHEPVEFEIHWNVTRREVRKRESKPGEALSAEARALWLTGSLKVPIGGKPLELIRTSLLPVEPWDKARVFYDRVLSHMSYDKSQPGYGTGDAVWACDSRFGNCTDFHSLFMSLARSHCIPTRFEIGYPLPPGTTQGDICGYHCWAWFHEQIRGWSPVDISEADKHPQLSDYYFGSLSADRIAFSVGRDIILEPPQRGPALNYFVRPYVEVDGHQIHDSDLEFSLSFCNTDNIAPE